MGQVCLSFRKRDNLHIKDKRPVPNLSVIRKFCIIMFNISRNLQYIDVEALNLYAALKKVKLFINFGHLCHALVFITNFTFKMTAIYHNYYDKIRFESLLLKISLKYLYH